MSQIARVTGQRGKVVRLPIADQRTSAEWVKLTASLLVLGPPIALGALAGLVVAAAFSGGVIGVSWFMALFDS